ncbi:hypothetical protein GCM10010406_07990 [Streptomyces thermolineatus]|uniref:Uncharacterized protein n=1 Tax=Streptomyces thermolineatus TaxID=44033 RepID=A0ABN1UK30_9ACTN
MLANRLSGRTEGAARWNAVAVPPSGKGATVQAGEVRGLFPRGFGVPVPPGVPGVRGGGPHAR